MNISGWAAIPDNFSNCTEPNSPGSSGAISTCSDISGVTENTIGYRTLLEIAGSLADIHKSSRDTTKYSTAFNWSLYREEFGTLMREAQFHEFLLTTCAELKKSPEAQALNIDTKGENAFRLGAFVCKNMYDVLRGAGLLSDRSLRREPDRIVASLFRTHPNFSDKELLAILNPTLLQDLKKKISEPQPITGQVEELARKVAKEALSRHEDKKGKKRKFEAI